MIQYKNAKGNLVTEQQIQMMDGYEKEILDDITGKPATQSLQLSAMIKSNK